MTTQDILRSRLSNQLLSQHMHQTPEEVVAHLGAVQSQDFAGAKWALGQRLDNITDQSIEQAFTNGKIIRTHILRPTWHFVHPEDISWMLDLTGNRVSKAIATYNKQLELDNTVFQKAHHHIVKLLLERKQVTRQEIKAELEKNGIKTNVQRLAHIVMQAEVDKVVCSGPRQAKQFTYMLFSERIPKTKEKSLEEALGELVKRYFTSHGPATLKDFVWWSGLTVIDGKRGLELNKYLLAKDVIDGKEYYFLPNTPTIMPTTAFLLPNYDEYTVAYKDRDAYFNPRHASFFTTREGVAFWNMIVYQGKGIASWRKEQKKSTMEIMYKMFETMNKEEKKAIEEAIQKYERFLEIPIQIKS